MSVAGIENEIPSVPRPKIFHWTTDINSPCSLTIGPPLLPPFTATSD